MGGKWQNYVVLYTKLKTFHQKFKNVLECTVVYCLQYTYSKFPLPSDDVLLGEQNLSAEEYSSHAGVLLLRSGGGAGPRPRTLSVSPSLQQQQMQMASTPSLRPNNSFTSADFEKKDNKKKENNQVN